MVLPSFEAIVIALLVLAVIAMFVENRITIKDFQDNMESVRAAARLQSAMSMNKDSELEQKHMDLADVVASLENNMTEIAQQNTITAISITNRLNDLQPRIDALEKIPQAHPPDLRFGGREEVGGQWRTILVCRSCGKAQVVEDK